MLMCQSRNSTKVWLPNQRKWVKLDDCIVDEIRRLNGHQVKTLASCCGHGRYPKTIVYKWNGGKTKFDWNSGKIIPRKKRFYVKDKQEFYFIPETLLLQKKNR
jgi:hypothetical protein